MKSDVESYVRVATRELQYRESVSCVGMYNVLVSCISMLEFLDLLLLLSSNWLDFPFGPLTWQYLHANRQQESKELLCMCFISGRDNQQCISVGPELGCAPRTNDYQSKPSNIKSFGLTVNMFGSQSSLACISVRRKWI